jgi:hypothetical protein
MDNENICKKCSKKFHSSAALAMHTDAKHSQGRLISAKNKKRIRNYAIIIVIFLFIGYGVYYEFNKDYGPKFQYGKVHWHAKIKLETCGEYHSISGIGSENNHVGNDILHTHGDNLYHLEGSPTFISEITLGEFFEVIHVPVSDDRMYDYKNGQACPNGTIGYVKMTVNDISVANITGYVPKDQDNITIIFG